VTRTPGQFATGTLLGNENCGGVSAVSPQASLCASNDTVGIVGVVDNAVCDATHKPKTDDSRLFIRTNCVTLPIQGRRVSGPEANMARRRYQKGSIRRRGNRWELRWREDVVLADGTVRREQRTTLLGTIEEFKTKRLAEREAASFLARVNRLDYRPVKREMFADFAERWRGQVQDLLKPSTAKVMASHLRFHLVPVFGRMRLDEIGQEDVQAFVGKLAKGRSRHTILNVLGTLASVLKMARKWGYAVAGFQQADLVIPCSKPGKLDGFSRQSRCGRFLRLLQSRGRRYSR